MLALHFWAWNASLRMTTITASTLLVDMQPVIVAGASAMWLKESPSRGQWIGILIAVAGAMIVGLADAGSTSAAAPPHAVLGDLLAFSGAITGALYYLVGPPPAAHARPLAVRGARVRRLPRHAARCSRSSRSTPLLPQPPREFAIFAALALGPMMLGHTGMNWALRYLPAYVVNLTVLGEPIGATIIAALLPGIREIPPPLTLAGGAVLLPGIFITLMRTPGVAHAPPVVTNAA